MAERCVNCGQDIYESQGLGGPGDRNWYHRKTGSVVCAGLRARPTPARPAEVVAQQLFEQIEPQLEGIRNDTIAAAVDIVEKMADEASKDLAAASDNRQDFHYGVVNALRAVAERIRALVPARYNINN